MVSNQVYIFYFTPSIQWTKQIKQDCENIQIISPSLNSVDKPPKKTHGQFLYVWCHDCSKGMSFSNSVWFNFVISLILLMTERKSGNSNKQLLTFSPISNKSTTCCYTISECLHCTFSRERWSRCFLFFLSIELCTANTASSCKLLQFLLGFFFICLQIISLQNTNQPDLVQSTDLN